MDTITLKLKPKYREEIELILQTDKESDYFDIPNGKEMVYNDNIINVINHMPCVLMVNKEMPLEDSNIQLMTYLQAKQKGKDCN